MLDRPNMQVGRLQTMIRTLSHSFCISYMAAGQCDIQVFSQSQQL